MDNDGRFGEMREEQLLAIALGGGRGATMAAQAAWSWAGSAVRLLRVGTAELAAVPAIGPRAARRMAALLELSRRMWTAEGREMMTIRSAADVDRRLRGRLAWLEQELFVALALDAKGRVMQEIDVAMGGAGAVCFRAADAFRVLVREGAIAAVFAHNHPSGDPAPSDQDLALTAELMRAGKTLGIEVRDHVIVAREGFHSVMYGRSERARGLAAGLTLQDGAG